MSVVILLADGARPDTLGAALARGSLPALAQLHDEGGGKLRTVTSCFPSVTGPAYAPFLMGRFPGPIGLPGLRWFDRAREACSFPDYTRSYVGYQIGAVDSDIDPDAPTIFELCDSSLGALNVISRGLAKRDRIGSLSLRSAYRAARTHFAGNVAGWLDIDRHVAADVARRVREDKPEIVFAALTGVDKVSHSRGYDSPMIIDALQIVDGAAAEIRRDAERDGRWNDMQLWIVSDHGHSRVTQHEDLVRLVEAQGHRTMSHPFVIRPGAEIAVMVSGNAMAHLYVDVRARARHDDIGHRYGDLCSALLQRPSVDLLMLPQRLNARSTAILTRDRGDAVVSRQGNAYSYKRQNSDPLAIGRDLLGVSADEAYEATIDTEYPDSVVQIVHIGEAPRSGEIILSAAYDWDFRARYEPIPHVSSHGALHREHMLVPLLLNRPVRGRPRRTVDVMPSALAALGKQIPPGLDGRSFF